MDRVFGADHLRAQLAQVVATMAAGRVLIGNGFAFALPAPQCLRDDPRNSAALWMLATWMLTIA